MAAGDTEGAAEAMRQHHTCTLSQIQVAPVVDAEIDLARVFAQPDAA